MEDYWNREELVQKYGQLLTPTIIIDHEKILGFGINREKIVKLLKRKSK